MAKKVEGLTVVSRDSERGKATYEYKGVRIEKYTRDRGYRGRIRGSYNRAGAVYTFSTQFYNADAIVTSRWDSVKNYKLQDAVTDIDRFLDGNAIAENGKVIIRPDQREILRQRGELSA